MIEGVLFRSIVTSILYVDIGKFIAKVTYEAAWRWY